MPKKRANNKMYERKITLGRSDDGNLIRKSVYATSKGELERKCFELKQEYLAGSGNTEEDITLKAYAKVWYDTYKAVRSINTRAMYLNVIDKHLVPDVGGMYLRELTDMRLIQGVINRNKLKPETCKKIKITVVQIFDQAQRDGLIETHSMRKLSLPPSTKKEKRALTESEKKLVTGYKWSDKQRAFLYLAYFTGARREEILALTRADINLDKGTVSYDKTVVYDRGVPTLVRGTKAQASTRTVPLPDTAAEYLKQYVSDMAPDALMFTQRGGGYMSLSSYTKFWNGIRKVFTDADASSADLTAHIFRHTYATMLYYSGISVKKAAQLLGHANTNMIMKVYAHIDDEREDSLGKLNKVFE